MNRVTQLTTLLADLVAEGAIDSLALRESLEARAPASVKALANDLDCYARFCARVRGEGFPAGEARIVAYLEDCEARKLKPASVFRRLSSLAVVHDLLNVPSPTRGPIVRDALRGYRRRVDVSQRQAVPLRYGEEVGIMPARGFSLSVLLQACPGTLPGLRDAALLSLAYDTGLQVSELVRVACEHILRAKDGSAVLTMPTSRSEQEGQGACAWLSPDTVERIDSWLKSSATSSGPVFRRIGVLRTKERRSQAAEAMPAPPGFRWRLPAGTTVLAPSNPAMAMTTFVVGGNPLTPAAVRLIIKRTARRAADRQLVNLSGRELDLAIAALSTHSLRVGRSQDLFASGEDAGLTTLLDGRKLSPSTNTTARMLRDVRR